MNSRRLCSSSLVIGTLCIVLIWFSFTISAMADETDINVTTISNLMMATEDITVRTEKNNKADELVTYHEGDTVFVTGQTDDGWYTISYRGQMGYFQGEGKAEPVKESDKVTDVTTLAQEMEQQAVESLYMGEEVIRYKESRRKATIWAVVIGGAIAGISVAAFFSAKKKGKDKIDENQVDEILEEASSVEQKEADAELLDEMVELYKNQEVQDNYEGNVSEDKQEEEIVVDAEKIENKQEETVPEKEPQEKIKELQGEEDEWNELINQSNDIEFIDFDDDIK